VSNYIESEMLKHCDEASIINININFSNIVAIETNTDIINENGKGVGKVLLNYSDKSRIYLNMIVEYNKDKIKWVNSKLVDGKKLILINPYWVKAYAPSPKLEVPINVYNEKTDQFVIEMIKLNYNQFMKRRLLEYYRTFKYVIVAAYDNFCFLRKNNQYHFALNSTVKHYGIRKDDLVSVIGKINNKKKQIGVEWNKLLRQHFQENESAKMINDLLERNKKENETSNVVSLRDVS